MKPQLYIRPGSPPLDWCRPNQEFPGAWEPLPDGGLPRLLSVLAG